MMPKASAVDVMNNPTKSLNKGLLLPSLQPRQAYELLPVLQCVELKPKASAVVVINKSKKSLIKGQLLPSLATDHKGHVLHTAPIARQA